MPIEMNSSNTMSSTQRYLYLSLIVVTIFVGSMCFSLQGPIFPEEAAKKGLHATQYGFVFGVFQLVVFITSPIYGKMIGHIGATFLLKAGVFATAWCTVLFGFLGESPPGETFLGLSAAVRIATAFGEAAVYTASYVIAVRCYPNATATALAFVETAFGAGGIFGPTVGGILYEVGGFQMPFTVAGVLLFFLSFLTFFFIKELSDVESSAVGPNIFHVLCIPVVLILSYAIIIGATSLGFITAFLEPHLRSFDISISTIGVIFMAHGGTYTLTAMIWGKVADRYKHFRILNIIAILFFIMGYLLLGPAPFIPFKESVPLVIIALIVIGVGLGGILVCCVMGLMDEIISHGSPKNMATQGFVSGLYNSLFAVGAFLGPTVGGPLYDNIGFESSCLVILGMFLIGLSLFLSYELFLKCKTSGGSSSASKTAFHQSKLNSSKHHLEWTVATKSENESLIQRPLI